MNILIDNKDITSFYSIRILDYAGALAFSSERENEREWYNKSGVDRNLVNARFEAKEFTMKFYVKADNGFAARNLVNVLVEYMLEKKVFVLSFRDTGRGIRECFLCERSKTIVPTVSIREQNSLYIFKLGFKDVNPNAIKYKTQIIDNTATIEYTKGQTASIYWGNGDQGLVDNSGNYTKDDYSEDDLVDIIIDIDKTQPDFSQLTADFEADKLSIIKPDTINFTDLSVGNITVYSWIISKNGNVIYTNEEKNPSIEFTESGTFDVTLQVFNEAAGTSIETKEGYITVRNSRMLVSDSGDFALASDSPNDYGELN